MVNDSLSDFLNRLVNGAQAKHLEVKSQYSRLLEQFASSLKSAGFLKDVSHNQREIVAKLNTDSPISGFFRYSSPSLRRYVKSAAIPAPKSGFGVVFLTTPKGILTGFQARKQKVGGELICEIW